VKAPDSTEGLKVYVYNKTRETFVAKIAGGNSVA
jgi:hypothetical protein